MAKGVYQHKPMSDETKLKISNSLKGKNTWMLGKKFSDETKKKISLSNTGKVRSEEFKDKHRGINNYNWTGDNCSYETLHMWLKNNYGKADHCEKCDNGKSKKFEWANISGEYKRDINDFIQLCKICHTLMDRGDECRQGHKFTEINTWIRTVNDRTFRVCRECQRGYSRKYQNRNKHL